MDIKKVFLESEEFDMALAQFEKMYEAGQEAEREKVKYLTGFVDEALEHSLYGSVMASDLYEAYENWAREKGVEKLGSNVFGKEIKKVLTYKRLAKGIHYMGVAIK